MTCDVKLTKVTADMRPSVKRLSRRFAEVILSTRACASPQ